MCSFMSLEFHRFRQARPTSTDATPLLQSATRQTPHRSPAAPKDPYASSKRTHLVVSQPTCSGKNLGGVTKTRYARKHSLVSRQVPEPPSTLTSSAKWYYLQQRSACWGWCALGHHRVRTREKGWRGIEAVKMIFEGALNINSRWRRHWPSRCSPHPGRCYRNNSLYGCRGSRPHVDGRNSGKGRHHWDFTRGGRTTNTDWDDWKRYCRFGGSWPFHGSFEGCSQ